MNAAQAGFQPSPAFQLGTFVQCLTCTAIHSSLIPALADRIDWCVLESLEDLIKMQILIPSRDEG